ncbi:conserved hypothetical protein [Ruegeria sp. TrichCH4B]|nr:conserved hypothetical protein [Ruegeria sp. TrichCH4B]
MTANLTNFEILVSARKVANFAASEGIKIDSAWNRPTYEHIGAVFADSILQAGLNYSTVVRPRIDHILRDFCFADNVAALVEIIEAGETSSFLSWTHETKIKRFEALVRAAERCSVSSVDDLRSRLKTHDFERVLLAINGVGPKTFDYMSCLVGIESIAVDRHIRTYARRAGVEDDSYSYLKRVFCFAADLLTVSRRSFDSWVWEREKSRASKQMSFDLAI